MCTALFLVVMIVPVALALSLVSGGGYYLTPNGKVWVITSGVTAFIGVRVSLPPLPPTNVPTCARSGLCVMVLSHRGVSCAVDRLCT